MTYRHEILKYQSITRQEIKGTMFRDGGFDV